MKALSACIFAVLVIVSSGCSTSSPELPLRRGAVSPARLGPPPSFPAPEAEATSTESAEEKKPAPTGKKAVKPLPQLIEEYKSGLVGGTSVPRSAEGTPTDKERQKVVLNFEKADVSEVTSQIFGDYLKLNYVMDPTLQGRISFYLDGEYNKEELLQLVTKAYQANNISVVPRKGVFFIQPNQRSSNSSLPIASSLILQGDKTGVKPVIVIYRLKYIQVKQAINTIKFLLSPGRPITSDNLTNSLIFVEDTDNARSIVDVLKALDVNIFKEVSMEIVPVHAIAPHDAAQSMEAMLGKLDLFKESAVKSNVAFIPLQNFAGVLVLAHDPEVLRLAKQWLTALDVQGEEAGEQIHVYFVKNGLAKDIADILNQVFGLGGATSSRPQQQIVRSTGTSFGGRSAGFGSSSFGSSSFGTSAFGGTTGTSGLGGSTGLSSPGLSTSGSSGLGGTTSAMGGTSGGTAGTLGGRTSGRGYQGFSGTLRSGGAVGGPAPTMFSGEVMIIADEVNNAIVIRANAQDYTRIKKTIETLDIVPRAVLIEVMIAEITLNKTLNYGIEWFFHNIGITVGGKSGVGGAGFNAGNPSGSTSGGFGSTFINTAFDMSQVMAPGGLSLFWGSIDKDISGLINLLASKTDVNILSTPTLLATDNKEASITVGGSQPVPTGSYATGVDQTTGTNAFTTIQYAETGIILNVIPHINAGGLVRLELDQTIRNPSGDATVGANNTAPTFSERNIKTTLLAHDGSTIVIGGIIQQTTNNAKSGIPGLLNMPIISPLFSTDSKTKARTELIIAITPHVIGRPSNTFTQEFLDRLRTLKHSIELKR
jgi:general secretion pathway protein D